MALTLLQQYHEAGGEFNARIVAAMAKKAHEDLLQIKPADPDYKQRARLAKAVLSAKSEDVLFAARALIAAGLTNASKDLDIVTSVNDKFQYIATLFDPDLGSDLDSPSTTGGGSKLGDRR